MYAIIATGGKQYKVSDPDHPEPFMKKFENL